MIPWSLGSMRKLTAEELEDFAERYDVPIDLAQRDYVACRIAQAIASDPTVADVIAFKGGFVLRIGHASPRTSKDIDGTLGTRKQNLEPARLQRGVRNRCDDLSVKFEIRDVSAGTDTLDFGPIEYAGPIGRGRLALELSLREDWIMPRSRITIAAYGIPSFEIWAMALPEIVAEKWRCLVQRSPRRPGDPYDLWFLWTAVRIRVATVPEDELVAATIRTLVDRKVVQSKSDAAKKLGLTLGAYRPGWEGARGEAIPADSPKFDEVEKAVMAAAKDWTNWLG
jgi:Nucleotidyl transferase AbiEii toxin, Type IV TA system